MDKKMMENKIERLNQKIAVDRFSLGETQKGFVLSYIEKDYTLLVKMQTGFNQYAEQLTNALEGKLGDIRQSEYDAVYDARTKLYEIFDKFSFALDEISVYDRTIKDMQETKRPSEYDVLADEMFQKRSSLSAEAKELFYEYRRYHEANVEAIIDALNEQPGK